MSLGVMSVRKERWFNFAILLLGAITIHFVLVSRLKSANQPEARCQPQTNLVFLKTHKCGSSTIENILFRFALLNDLNVVIPKANNYICQGKLFNRTCLSSAPWKDLEFQLFALHTRWNYDEIRQLMGGDATYISVLRDPVDLFESLYSYYQLEQIHKANLSSFIEWIESNSSDPRLNIRHSNVHGRNQIAFDWGIDPDKFDDEEYISERIQEFDREFHLVLIAEKMHESLLILQRLLCWSLDDITHLEMNARKTENVVSLTPKERRILGDWLKADYMIYNHFSRKLEREIDKYNSRREQTSRGMNLLQRDLLELDASIDRLMDKCQPKKVDNVNLPKQFKEWSNLTFGYQVNQNLPECPLYATSEAAFLAMFRQRLTEKAKLEHLRIKDGHQS